MAQAIALVHQEGDVFGISFPDFPGCISSGRALDEAIERGGMALAMHVEGMAEDGEGVPVLRSADDIRRDPAFAEDVASAVIAAVPVDLPGKSVRVQITMDEHLLSALDRSAKARGATRSGAIAEAARLSLRG
jgi:predicted RNase H-like HicB family nuclease